MGLLCSLLVLGGCSGTGRLSVPEQPRPEEARLDGIDADQIAVDLFLIGDAGLPAQPNEPVLTALGKALAVSPDRSFVVFLGDNLYPSGLPDSTSSRRELGESILRAQMAPLLATGTRGIFVPGNHDWDAGDWEGWWNVVRQERFIELHGDGMMAVEPDGGCPGPDVVDLGESVRIIALDTQWWLHRFPKPGPGSPCPADTEPEVVALLRAALASAGERHVVVVGHHPFASSSEHGGYFDWPTYSFFPLPLARRFGFINQDIPSRAYQDMISDLSGAFAVNPPLIYAAGHEHNLQVFQGLYNARYLVVSGSGIYGHISPVLRSPNILYKRPASGFMRVTVLNDGRARLAALVVDAEGNYNEDFSMWLHAESRTE